MLAVVCWVALLLIHLLPALAFVRPSLLSILYGADIGSVTFILLHHRAALFFVVVVTCGWAAWKPEVRPLASVAVAISMLSFLWLYFAGGQPSGLRQIAIADLIGVPFLTIAAWLAWAGARAE